MPPFEKAFQRRHYMGLFFAASATAFTATLIFPQGASCFSSKASSAATSKVLSSVKPGPSSSASIPTSARSALVVPRSSAFARKNTGSRLFSSGGGRPSNTFNPFRMVGDVASNLFSGDATANDGISSKVDAKLSNIVDPFPIPSWSEIRTKLESLMETDEERNFRKNLEKGYGVGSPLHKTRLFHEKNKEEDIRVTFYRDSASWCPYCMKVWLMLEEKQIPYRVEKINMRCYGDKPASFFQIQPGGQIPVAIIDGRIYGQSNDIMYALEELFTPENGYKSLSPSNSNQQTMARDLLRLERELFGAWMFWLTGGGDGNKKTFIQVLNRVEKALSQTGPFFLGKSVSMVDFMYASFLERMAASLLYFKGFFIRVAPGTPTDYPAINKWFDAMETLPSYQLSKSDYYTHCWDLPPQLGGCTYETGCEPYEKAINGELALDGARGSWELPLQPHNGGVEPDWSWAGGDLESAGSRAAKREAVERVTGNYEAIVQFACRGAGKKGIPPVSAPLADPNAIPSKAVQGAVDACLRTVCQALLEDVEAGHAPSSKQPSGGVMSEVAKVIVTEGGHKYAEGVIDSLAYMRDRIGVPRDMKLPAARHLRAHLNWAIQNIEAKK